MALAPWNILAGGKLRSDAEEQRRKESGERGRELYGAGWERTPEEKKMSNALEKVASEVGGTVASVAIPYLMQKTAYVVPIVGGRKVKYLMDNIKALDLALTPAHVAYIESVSKFDISYPNTMIGSGDALNFFFQNCRENGPA